MKKFDFQNEHSEEKRIEESTSIKLKYPDRIPIIVERMKDNTEIEEIDKRKFLVPSDLTVGQFVYVIRKRIKLSPDKAIFLFINGTIPGTSMLMSQVYKEYKNQDGFVYINYSGESTFGTFFTQ